MQQTLFVATPNQAPLTREKLAQMHGDLKEKGDEKGSDFLSLMLSQLSAPAPKKEVAALPIPLQTAPKESPKVEAKGLEDIAGLEIEKATFVQILHLLETLNGGKKTLSFPKLTQKIQTLLAQEGIQEEFKNVKSLQDLLTLSKKYNLGLEKITFTQQETKTLETFFPKLAEKQFFEPKKESIASEALLKSKQPETSQKKEQEPTTLKDLLRSLEPKKEEKAEVKIPAQTEEKKQVKGEAKPEIRPDAKVEVKAEIKTEVKGESKTEIKGETKPQNGPQTQPQLTPEVKNQSKNEGKIEINTQGKGEEKREEKTKQTPKEASLNTALNESKHNAKAFNEREIRNESIRVQMPSMPASEKEVAPSQTRDASLKILSELSQSSQRGSEQEGTSQEGENKHQSAFSKEVGKQQQSTLKTPQLRHTFNTFAQDFKEQVENYRPPMMKIQLALNPKNLGEVDVTLINRGNNLHVSFTSNTTQTLSLFVQNQAEFKNALVNMGFTNLEMNFSEKQHKEGESKKGSKGEFSQENEEQHEEEQTLELVLPNYV